MSALAIKDLAAHKELDREAMTEVVGGTISRHPSISILSPDLYNMVTKIDGYAAVPTWQTNNLVQTDYTVAENHHGINFISNNKKAMQYNSNSVYGFLNPSVG